MVTRFRQLLCPLMGNASSLAVQTQQCASGILRQVCRAHFVMMSMGVALFPPMGRAWWLEIIGCVSGTAMQVCNRTSLCFEGLHKRIYGPRVMRALHVCVLGRLCVVAKCRLKVVLSDGCLSPCVSG